MRRTLAWEVARISMQTAFLNPQTGPRPKAVVAIPAQDEAAHIESCLSALARQTRLPDAVFVLVNNSVDSTAQITAGMRWWLPFRLDVESHEFCPEAMGAGPARRLAMDRAMELAGADGCLLTTDADAVVAPDWVERNLEGLARGCDAVCGRAFLNPLDAHRIPAHLHDDDKLECHLIDLLDRMAWIRDPEVHDPHPRHTEAPGASLAVTAEAFRAAGGMPAVPNGEDRLFVRTLWTMDRRVRHDPRVSVMVSGRLDGRAKGGMADTIRRRLVRQDELTDEQVEPASDGWRRYGLRKLVRTAWSERRPSPGLADSLAIAEPVLSAAIALPFFGAAWDALEVVSPVLMRRRVAFVDLPREIDAAETTLGHRDLMAAD